MGKCSLLLLLLGQVADGDIGAFSGKHLGGRSSDTGITCYQPSQSQGDDIIYLR
jgi:hypothetical protein